MKLFAKAGEHVTCTNGHIICTVAQDIVSGDIYTPTYLKDWTQAEPKTGALPEVKCDQCGALFWHGYKGQHFHFSNGWRKKKPVKAWMRNLEEASGGN